MRREWRIYGGVFGSVYVRTLTVGGDVQVLALAGESWFAGAVQFATRSGPASWQEAGRGN